MKRLEFNEVLKAMNIDKKITSIMGDSGMIEVVHSWEEITLNFAGTSYAVIKGKIPSEVVKAIYEQYPNNPYRINSSLGENVGNHNDVSIGDEYIQLCHVYTKEGLLALLTGIKDYYARKKGIRITQVQILDELMPSICSEMLKQVDPSVSIYEWMQGDEENRQSFLKTLIANDHTPFKHILRNAIDEFDKAVNPYLNKDIELDDISNYIKRVRITADTCAPKEKNRKDYATLQITDLTTKNKVCYERHSDGFLFALQYYLDNGQLLTISHSFSNSSVKEEDGEMISIKYLNFRNPTNQDINLKYNITREIIQANHSSIEDSTINYKQLIYNELLKATNYAASVTIQNMKQKSPQKQMLPDSNK